MNNLLSYCGLVDARISASDKYLPVREKFIHTQSVNNIIPVFIALTAAPRVNPHQTQLTVLYLQPQRQGELRQVTCLSLAVPYQIFRCHLTVILQQNLKNLLIMVLQ